MIKIGGSVYPLNKSLLWYNTVLISPWTGKLWATIDRGRNQWHANMMAAEGEPAWPLSESISGTIFTDYDMHMNDQLREFPRAVLLREISLVEGLTSATLSCDNGSTIGDMQMTPDLLKEIATLRTKVETGTITDEELRNALKKMREGRVAAVRSASTKRAAAAKTNPDDALAAFLS